MDESGARVVSHMMQLPSISSEIALCIIRRLEGWKALVIFLFTETDALMSSEKSSLSVLMKSTKTTKNDVINVMSQFPEDSKISALGNTIVNEVDEKINQKEAFINTVKTQILPNLKTIRSEISEKISNFTAMSKESTKDFQKEVKRSSELFEKLGSLVLSSAQMSLQDNPDPNKDPWVVCVALSKSIKSSREKYDHSIEKIGAERQAISVWEAEVSVRVSSNVALLLNSYKKRSSSDRDSQQKSSELLFSVDPAKEWSAFETTTLSKCTIPVSVSQVLRVPQDKLIVPIMEGPMKYLSKMLKKWKKCYLVLTPLGWLHQFNEKPNLESTEAELPKKSIWLKTCGLSPLQIPGQTHEELSLIKSDKGGFSTSKSAFARFNSINRESLQPWWDAISKLTKINLRAEENVHRESDEQPASAKSTKTSTGISTEKEDTREEDTENYDLLKEDAILSKHTQNDVDISTPDETPEKHTPELTEKPPTDKRSRLKEKSKRLSTAAAEKVSGKGKSSNHTKDDQGAGQDA